MRFKSKLRIVFLITFWGLSLKGYSSGQSSSYEAPNVIFILVDDMGYGDLGCYGQSTLETPHIDEMASNGMRFTNMYTGSTVCAPSRASLMSGKHTGNCSVKGNTSGQLLKDEENTLGKVFKREGYITGAIGKWGIGHPIPTDDPKQKGFDYFYGYLNMVHAHNFYPEFLYQNGEKVYLQNKTIKKNGKSLWENMPEGTGVAAVKKQYVHDLFDDKALEFIEQNKSQKFFLYLAYNVPHANNEAGTYCNDGMEVPDYGTFEEEDWPNPEKGFARMIHNIDNSVGMILRKLKEADIDKNTLVIFCSDNGPHQEGNHQMEFFNSNGDWRGMKRDLYEGGVKTPFIAYWPGRIEPDSQSDQVLAFWDILPTFNDLINQRISHETDGISFLPTLLSKKQKKKHKYLYWEFHEKGGKQAIRFKDWKGIKLNTQKKAATKFYLYNLKSDPHELKDLSAQYPGLVRKLENWIKLEK